MLYPILFEPIYKQMVWGGNGLNRLYGRVLPFARIGESWDITCRPKEMGIVKNGLHQGLTFTELVKEDRVGWLGKNLADCENFPLLVKLIDANDSLSIQVHPDDTLAQTLDKAPLGKAELWYILDAPEDAYLVLGLREGVTPEALRQAVADKQVEACVNELPVKKGDVINIPAGLIHALTRGVMVAEIQQNSDLTYRVYDYNRLGLDGKPRELHLEKALRAIDFRNRLKKEPLPGLSVPKEGSEIAYYIANPNFALTRYTVKGLLPEQTDGLKFCLFTCVEGTAKLSGDWGETLLSAGDTTLVPAGLGSYTLEGSCTLLKSWVPDIQEDFIEPLMNAGYSFEEIKNKAAVS